MKINIEDYLHKIDNVFLEKTQKDIYMIYLMTFSLIFAFSYLMLWDLSENEFTTKRGQVVAIEQKISADNIYLQRNPQAKVTTLQNEINKAQKQMLVYKDNNQYIKTKIEDISSLIYDEQTWGKYLYSISLNAKVNKIKILEFKNSITDKKSSFGHILDIHIATEGNYINTMNFINSLEQSELVVDLHKLNIESKNKINATLDISVWGITY